MLRGHPEWWEWELEITSHAEKRMEHRDFTELDLRRMFDSATGFREDYFEGRWVVETAYQGDPWEVIVEPDTDETLLVVITAYAIGT